MRPLLCYRTSPKRNTAQSTLHNAQQYTIAHPRSLLRCHHDSFILDSHSCCGRHHRGAPGQRAHDAAVPDLATVLLQPRVQRLVSIVHSILAAGVRSCCCCHCYCVCSSGPLACQIACVSSNWCRCCGHERDTRKISGGMTFEKSTCVLQKDRFGDACSLTAQRIVADKAILRR